MKRAEQLAWGALAGLLVIAALLLTGGIAYKLTAFWAGTMLAAAQALVVGLAAWGLMLARQAQELNELPPPRTTAPSFRMGGEHQAQALVAEPVQEVRTLDTGFQRLLVAISGVLLAGFGLFAAILVYRVYSWAAANPDQQVPVGGTFAVPTYGLIDLGLITGLAAAALYILLYWLARPKRDPEGFGEAVTGNFTLGITGMVALAIGAILAYFRVAWASELAAAVIAFLMLLQGLELIVNACRSYSSIEELDQEAIDLQTTPLGPMLSSVWLQGLRMLFAQSVGLGSDKAGRADKGVIARMMPRALAAIIIIAIGVSCLRVVRPGYVAVLERLGYAPTENGQLSPSAILHSGLHFTFPWPIDQLVMIPTETLQQTNVGTDLHTPKAWKGIDFQFWMVRDDTTPDTDVEDLFRTGDSAPQILETFVQVQWRVTDPAAFYMTMSHSEYFQRSASETRTVPIYEAIVQQCTAYAVTRAFAIHKLEDIMISDRSEVEAHCRQILQQKLDSLGKSIGLPGCGISIDYLTIKDLHPPYWHGDRPNDPTQQRIGGDIKFTDSGVRVDPDRAGRSQMSRGPASAFEFVTSMSEFKQQLIAMANGEVTAKINDANGFAQSTVNLAKADSLAKIARAHGDADRLVKITERVDPMEWSGALLRGDYAAVADMAARMNPREERYQLSLMEQRLFYATLKDLLGPVNKVIHDPGTDVQIYQATEKGAVPAPVVGP